MEKNHFPLIMKVSAAVAVLGFAALTVLYRILPHPHILSAAVTLCTTAYHFLMRLAVGYIIPRVTRYDFDYHSRWFLPRKWEASLYRKTNVKFWKGKIPTYAPEQFSLKTNSLHRVIQNTCGAEIVHEIIMVLSFLPLVLVPFLGVFPVFFITSALAALYDSIFVIAQRYNRPRLVRILEKQEAKAHE